jgi:hypothetical protein
MVWTTTSMGMWLLTRVASAWQLLGRFQQRAQAVDTTIPGRRNSIDERASVVERSCFECVKHPAATSFVT